MMMNAPESQERSPAPDGALLTTAQAVQQQRAPATLSRQIKEAAARRAAIMALQQEYRDNLQRELAYRLDRAVRADDELPEQLLRFWSNHFAVSVDKQRIGWLVGCLERETLRPGLERRFGDLLFAAVTHPAMLLYLDNWRSSGPNSPAGRRNRGLNENLAREVLELHTLGVRSGYTQADVTELARVLTGWTLFEQKDGWTHGFNARQHEPGERVILGRRYPEGGAEQLRQVLADLARRPETRRHLCTKLAQFFFADDPDPDHVAGLEKAWGDGDGDLAAVNQWLRAQLARPGRPRQKLRTPEELVVEALRALPSLNVDDRAAYRAIQSMGQRVWAPPSPAGWPDRADDWLGSDALWKRVEWAVQWAGRVRGQVDVRKLSAERFGRALSEETRRQIAGAESRTQAVALLLASPEMQRR